MDVERLFIGIFGAFVGVVGWLFVGMYIQRRQFDRQARNAARAVYFEVGANHLAVFLAREYGAFGHLSRSTYERLLPELATWLPAEELQALALSYLGHAGYEQAASDPDLPAPLRQRQLTAIHDAHRVAVELVRRRAFSPKEIDRLTLHASTEQQRLMDLADEPGTGQATAAGGAP